MNVSILIPTLGRRRDLLETLESVARQTHPIHGAVVVDASEPAERQRTRGAIARLELSFPVTYLETDRPGMTVQRNHALSRVPEGTEIVLWLDDDVVLEPTYVAELISVFEVDPRIGAVAGVFQPVDRTREHPLSPLYRRLFLLEGREGTVLPSGMNVTVQDGDGRLVEAEWLFGCAAYRRDASRDLRFDEGLGRYALLEDVDYSYRVGRRWRLIVNTRARLFHKRSEVGRVSVRELERLHVRNRLRFLRRNAWSPAHLAAFAWSTLGLFLLHLATFARHRRPRDRERALGTLEGIALCVRGDHLRPSLADVSSG